MTIAVDFIDYLIETPEFKELVDQNKIATDPSTPKGMVFAEKPYTTVDNFNRKALLVITSNETWDAPLRGRGLDFPLMHIDIWAAPTKNLDGSIEVYDADDLISEIYKGIRPLIHLVHSGMHPERFEWGKTRIVDSEVLSGPTTNDVRDGNGARMGRIDVGVSV